MQTVVPLYGFGGGGTGTKMELLWENASPDSGFSAQTISLTLSEGDVVRIYAVNSPSSPALIPPVDIPVGKTGYIIGKTDSNALAFRSAGVTETGIAFTACNYGNASTDSHAIPYKIYRLKGVSL